MRKGLKLGFSVAALAATLSAGVYIGVAYAAQPHMDAALEALRTARGELMEAEHNKAGHRAEALRLTNEAIHETELGIEDAH
jgi:malonyl CoA-acyl carrier protein transacylase